MIKFQALKNVDLSGEALQGVEEFLDNTESRVKVVEQPTEYTATATTKKKKNARKTERIEE
jgi:hypothetical protein